MTLEALSYDGLIAISVSTLTLLALLVIKNVVALQLRKLVSSGRLRFFGLAEQILNATRRPFMCGVALLAGVSQLELTQHQEKWLHYAWVVILISQIALWANRLVHASMSRVLERERTDNPSGATHMMIASVVARIAVWTVAVLAALDNLGINISALMASLGIGGIAVALAAQTILGDLFASVSIALDKPFVIGDFIIVDDYLGTVQYVGLKTTRLQSLSGEQIIFSNSELLKNRIRNYRQMQERRVVFEFGITEETPLELVREVPVMVKEIITGGNLSTRFDRAHFKSYGESALQFEVVYYVLSPDYNLYMDIQQTINLELLQRFRQHSIALAYPTRTLYVASRGDDDTSAEILQSRRG